MLVGGKIVAKLLTSNPLCLAFDPQKREVIDPT